ncbi:MAG: cell envelope integrity protein TolA, partial [SAR324 cluster bacterium]|nr:cell envelope integrity protein TolA [SAR324 cluster bacterium]
HVDGESFSYRYVLERLWWWSVNRFRKGREPGYYLEIMVDCPGLADLCIRRRQRLDALWIFKEGATLKSGNDDFDSQFIAVSGSKKEIESYLALFENRQAIKRLFAEFDLIYCSNGVLCAVKDLRMFDTPAQGLIVSAAAQLQVLCRNMSTKVGIMESGCKPPLIRSWIKGLVLLALLSWSCFSIYHYTTLDIKRLSTVGALAGLVLSAIFVGIFSPWILRMKAGDETSARQGILATFLASFVILSCFCSAIILTLNCKYDDTPPRIVTALVLGREVGPLDDILGYQLFVKSWRNEGGVERMRVDALDWADAREGVDCVTLLLRDGRFGFPWIKSFNLASGTLDPMCAAQGNAALKQEKSSADLESEEKSETLEPEATYAMSAAVHLSDEQGLALEADPALKELFEAHSNRLIEHIMSSWSWDDVSVDLHASFQLSILKNGQLKKYKTVQRSGNAKFDSRALSVIKKSVPFPLPPKELAGYFDELRLDFHSRVVEENEDSEEGEVEAVKKRGK